MDRYFNIPQRRHFFVLFFCLGFFSIIAADDGVKYEKFLSPHFEVWIPEGNTELAQEVIPLFEDVLQNFIRNFHYTPEGEPFVVQVITSSDYANGYAIAMEGWISLYLPGDRFSKRGAHLWLPNVFAHELSHLVTLRLLGEKSSFFGVTAFTDWQYKRQSAQAVLPVSTMNTETWLAEGLAQLGSELAGYDSWDARRDMLLRAAWNHDLIVPPDFLRTFSGTSLESEMIYNQGYHFCRFVWDKIGADSFAKVLSKTKGADLRHALAKQAGTSFESLYEEWKNQLKVKYGEPGPWNLSASPESRSFPSEMLTTSKWGYLETSHFITTDANTTFLLSSWKNDYGIQDLYALQGQRATRLARDVSGPMRQDPATGLIYLRKRLLAPDQRELYQTIDVDPKTGKISHHDDYFRITDQSVYDSMHYRIRFYKNSFVLEKYIPGQIPVALKHFNLHEEIREVQVLAKSGKASALLLQQITSNGSQILKQSLKALHLAPDTLIPTSWKAQDMHISQEYLYFSAAPTGIFQIWRIPLNELETLDFGDSIQAQQLTTSPGGAFTPGTDGDTLLYFSSFGPQGFIPAKQRLQSFSPTAIQADSSSIFPEQSKPWEGKIIRTRKTLQVPEFTGFELGLGYSHIPPENTEEGISTGQRFIGQIGALFLSPDLENQFMVQTMFSKMPGHTLDFGVLADWQFSFLTPIVNLGFQYSMMTLDYSDDILSEDSTQIDEDYGHPRIGLLGGYGTLIQPWSAHHYTAATFSHNKLLVSMEDVPQNAALSFAALNSVQLVHQISYADFGKFHPNSGFSLQLLGNLLQGSILGIDTISTDTLIGYENQYSKSAGINFNIYENIGRRAYFALSALPQITRWKNSPEASFQNNPILTLSASMHLYPLRLRTSLPGTSLKRRTLSFRDPRISFLWTTVLTESDTLESSEGIVLHSPRQRPLQTHPLKEGFDVPDFLSNASRQHIGSIELSLLTISLWDFVGSWSVRVSGDPEYLNLDNSNSPDWDQFYWSASLVF